MICDIKLVLFYGSALGFSVLLSVSYFLLMGVTISFTALHFFKVCIFLIATSKQYAVVTRSKKEKYFLDSKTGKFLEFPKINDKSSINLSVVVPAYNEEIRCKILRSNRCF